MKYLMTSASLIAVTVAASAQDQRSVQHDEYIEELVVTSDPLRKTTRQSLQGTQILAGEDLSRALAATIGDTLDRLPGVAQTGFGPGASRPIIRGLGGDRIRVLVNGVGTIDASTTSPDHAVASDLSNAERVEVIRGPATLIYGNNASGGVVNVLDGRIPTQLPDDGLSGSSGLTYGTNADEILGNVGATASFGNNIAIHVDGFLRETDDIDIPGFARSDALQAAVPLEDGEEEIQDNLPNSDQQNFGGNVGISWIDDRGFFGVSVGYLDNNYGIPAELEGEEEGGDGEEEEGGVRIDIEQIRFDVAGDRSFDGFIETARLRFGYADYDQQELEGDEVGTLFLNDGWEGRLELAHAPIGALQGVFGVQLRSRDFAAIGEEAFVPANEQFQYGFFLVERAELGDWNFEGGLRFEFQDNDLEDDSLSRSFFGFSASAGSSYALSETTSLTGSVFYTERAPNPEELFSGGPHLATFTFEVGDPNLQEETSIGGELGLRWQTDWARATANVYYTSYDDYIVDLFTGELDPDEGALPVAQFSNQDAEFYGFEFDASFTIYEFGNDHIDLDIGADFVRAQLTDIDADVPRIPPLSLKAGLSYHSDRFDIRIDGEYADDQNRIFSDDVVLPVGVSSFEFPTDSYFLLNAAVDYRPFDDQDITLSFQARNITDDEVRLASSFLREFVPQQGFDARFSIRVGF